MGDMPATEQHWVQQTAKQLGATLAATTADGGTGYTHWAAVYLGRHRLVHLVEFLLCTPEKSPLTRPHRPKWWRSARRRR